MKVLIDIIITAVLIIIVFLLSALPLLISQARADTDILLGQWSYHYDREYQYNETHYLVGIDTGDYIVARFKNSYSRTSYTAMKAFDLKYGFRLAIGASTGYEDIYGYEIVPVVLLNKRFGHLDINFIPIVGLTAGFRF